ncbi:hypothetical protein EK21DRAFT_118346 [Setomelanomma holmii]|uniref:Uncharacterized protein n=1 Tax=Setomelanomma holmii TaxID=210430 RepID=A0A9P4LH72_9PLEO|nr:hypothetical protein EK21DRAFT_118346 [Setomelanomma holmii]
MNNLPIELLQHIVFYLAPVKPYSTTTAISNDSQNYIDILNTRLATQALAAAASQPFVDIISTHPWKLNTSSLNRLANLLLNVHVAKHTNHLTINTYRFSFDRDYTIETEGVLEDHVAARTHYVEKSSTSQLVKVFRRARNLRHLTIVPTVQQGDPDFLHKHVPPPNPAALNHEQSSIARSVEQELVTSRIPDPLEKLVEALRITRVHEHLESFSMLSAARQSQFEVSSHQLGIRLGYPVLKRLTVETDYLLNITFPFPCPRLEILELVGIERAGVQDFTRLQEGGENASGMQRIVELLSTVLCVTVIGTADGESIVEVNVRILVRLVGLLARCISRLDILVFRRLHLTDNGDDHVEQDNMSGGKVLQIGTLRLESVIQTQFAQAQSVACGLAVILTSRVPCHIGELVVDGAA